jgi:HEAT repeat protein
MKTLLFCLTPLLAICADQSPVQRLFDGKLNGSQRASACFELRGNSEPDIINAMGKALEDPAVLSCAAENLRIAGTQNPEAIDALKRALSSQDAQVRAAAVRQLGTFQKPELLDTIAQGAKDENLLVATNALSGLLEYKDPSVASMAIPYLADLASGGGIIGDMALDRLAQLQSAMALGIARELLLSSQVPDQLYAMRVIGAFGAASDLEQLAKIAMSSPENLSQRARGFGFMPAINLARAAQSAMESIRSRQ